MLGRYLRFCVVGGSGVVVDMGVLYLLADPGRLGWDLTWSKVAAAEVAVLNNFVWNEAWTFGDLARARRGWGARLGRLARFNLICVLGIGLSAGLLNAQVHGLGMNVYLANLLAIVVVSVWNFWLNLRLGWVGGR
ncbi:MAG: GtrA family protein [Verrucomicrobiae bacterium]|nr:GtrA family protein [Verrucomicrobiae bacterium]